MALGGPAAGRRPCAWPVLAVTVGLLAGTAAHGQPAMDARRAYAAGNYKRAYDLWMPLARAGDADAAFRLGLLADLGEGMPENAEAAYRWYWSAAQAGHPEAEFNVAVMHDSGRGTAHDVAAAAAWYGRAAARGNHRAQYNLALLYNDGDGVPRNPTVARAWFRLAASGVPAAMAKLHAAAPDDLSAQVRQQGDTPRAAIPVAPRPGATASGIGGTTEIVWAAPAEPTPVRYFLQVVARDEGIPHELYAAYLDVTAALVTLDPKTHDYAWRVFTVSPSRASYSVSPWTAFTS